MTIPYRIERIETVQFAAFPESNVVGQDIAVNTTVGFSIKSDLSNIRNTLKINYVQGEKLLLIVEINCYFAIDKEGVEAIKKKGNVPVDFLRYMGTISVGIARGVIHVKTEGTTLNAVVLPPINLVEMIKTDFVLQESEKTTSD